MADFTFWIVVGLTLGSAFMVVQSKIYFILPTHCCFPLWV